MKIYAKQVSPEYQESPLFWDDPADAWPGIIFDGNRDYKSHTTPEYDQVFPGLDDLTNVLDADGAFIHGLWYDNFTEAVNDIMPAPLHKPRYSTRDIHAWRLLAAEWYNTGEENALLCRALQLVTGKEHDYKTIRGCCQSDWQEIIFPVDDYPGDVLDILEADYFNTGTEWIIHDEDNEPETPEEISGSSLYCYSWNNDGIRAEIAAAAGADASDVILYEYAGSYTLPKYNKVGA